MPNWASQAEISKDADIFSKFMHAILGLYSWEWFVSLRFDWDFISGRKRFRWPMIFYFANRYILLGALVGIVVALDTPRELNCQALYTFNQLAGNASAGLASVNLSLRTMAVWQHHRVVDGLLIVLILGHWSLILQGVLLTAVWIPGQGCRIIETKNKILASVFVYTMSFDIIVLALNIWKLGHFVWRGRDSAPLIRSRLAQLIFRDGLIYFIVAFISNVVATVFMLLDLNPIMTVFFNVPAVVGSSIVACRLVRRLMNFGDKDPSHQISPRIPNSHTTIAFREGPAERDIESSITQARIEEEAKSNDAQLEMETFGSSER